MILINSSADCILSSHSTSPGTAADPPDVQGQNAHTGLVSKIARELERPTPLVALILAILGWSAAAHAFWNRFDGQRQQQPTPIVYNEDQDRSSSDTMKAARHTMIEMIRSRPLPVKAEQGLK